MSSRHVVTFHYTLRDEQGQLLDTSAGGAPISYLEGAGHIIEGLDEQLRGQAAGLKTNVQVPAAKAYGLRDETQVQRVKRGQLPIEGELKVGDRFQAGEDRYAPIVTVTSVEGDEVTLDANHPLAGVDLTFEVEIVAKRAATEKEIEHGHVHEDTGCGGTGKCGCKE